MPVDTEAPALAETPTQLRSWMETLAALDAAEARETALRARLEALRARVLALAAEWEADIAQSVGMAQPLWTETMGECVEQLRAILAAEEPR